MPSGLSWRGSTSVPRVSNQSLFELLSVCRKLSLFSCSVLRKMVADETAAKEALQVAYSSAQKDLADLEGTAVAVYQELEREGGSSGSSVASRLRSLGGQVAERLKSAFRLGVQRTLGMVSTRVVTGYVVVPGVEGDDAVAAMEQADATIEGAASALSVLLKGDLLSDA